MNRPHLTASFGGLALSLIFACSAQAQLGGLIGGTNNTVNNTQNAVNNLVSGAGGTLTSTLDSTLNTVGDVTGSVLSSTSVNSILPGGALSNALSANLETLSSSDSIVFSQAVRDTIAANSLPSSTSQRLGAFQSMGAATRDIGSRLLQLRAGMYLGGANHKLATEFSDDGGGKGGKVVAMEDGTYWVIYAQGDRIDLDIDSFGLAGTLDSRTWVATVAAEYHPNDYQTIGIAGSWSQTDTELGNRLGSSDVEGGVVSVYGSWYDGPFYVDGLLAYGQFEHDISRTALNSRTAIADTDSDAFTAQFNTGRHMDLGPFVTGPYLQAEYQRSEIDNYHENGAGVFNLAVNDQETDSLASEIGWQISMPIENASGYIAPHVRVGWSHQYLNDGDPVHATLRAFPANRLSLRPANLDDDYLILGGGLVISRHGSFTLSADYEAQIAEDFLRHAASVSLRIPF
ncbi:MAG: autotransporter outer membrane beta-barrel domain-containing protein [Verrucomicrobiales bacterium]|nr:autotransporter outer membrane beta-barrel domain-containing protein [Verrucomicrobiales bacterium]